MMTDTGPGSAHDPPPERGHAEGVVEKTCMLMSALALVVLLVLVGVDIVTRWAFNFSFEVSDEVLAHARAVRYRGREARKEWEGRYEAWRSEQPC